MVSFVRIFSYLIVYNLLMGQENNLEIPFYDKNKIVDSLNFHLKNEKELSTYYQINSIKSNPMKVIYKKKMKEKMVDSVFLKIDDIMAESINKPLLSYYQNKSINMNFENIGNELVSRYYFINDIPNTNFFIYDKNKIALQIDFYPSFENSTSAIFGLNKNSKSWDFNGEFNLKTENYMKQAEVFEIKWKKIDSLSQKLNFDFLLPHPFGYNTGIHWKYNFETVNGMYVEESREYSLKSFLPLINNLELGYVTGSTSPTLNGDMNNYKKNTYQAFLLNITKDSRNNRSLTTSGILYANEINLGLQNNASYFDFKSEYHLYLPFKNDLLLNIKYKSEGIFTFQGKTPKSRFKSYGGVKSLRGYDENQFFSEQYHIICLESGYNINKTSQIKFFIDQASNSLSRMKNIKIGYGFGLYQNTSKYLIEVEYALNVFRPSDGKVHFKLVSKF